MLTGKQYIKGQSVKDPRNAAWWAEAFLGIDLVRYMYCSRGRAWTLAWASPLWDLDPIGTTEVKHTEGGVTTYSVGRAIQPGCLRRIWAHEISFFVRRPELG